MLASDLNNPEYVNPKDPDAALDVVFHKMPVFQAFESEQKGEAVFKDVMYIKISTPGDVPNVIDTPLREEHKIRFRRRWEHYQKFGESGDHGGMPLGKWPLLQPAQVEMLKAKQFHTIEQIAGASDQQVAAIGMSAGMAPATLRDKARQQLAALRSNEANDAENAKNAARDKELADLKARDEVREKEMQEMKALLAQLTAPASGKGRITLNNAKAD